VHANCDVEGKESAVDDHPPSEKHKRCRKETSTVSHAKVIDTKEVERSSFLFGEKTKINIRMQKGLTLNWGLFQIGNTSP